MTAIRRQDRTRWAAGGPRRNLWCRLPTSRAIRSAFAAW